MEDVDNLLTSVLSVNLTLVSVRQNEDKRKIAAWARHRHRPDRHGRASGA